MILVRVLFALGSEQMSKKVAEKYLEKYGDELDYKNVFYFKALLEEVKKDKTYDRIVISEELEQFALKNLESLDKYIFEKVDSVTDEIDDSEIIFICSDRRSKDHDKFVERLFIFALLSFILSINLGLLFNVRFNTDVLFFKKQNSVVIIGIDSFKLLYILFISLLLLKFLFKFFNFKFNL